MKRRLQALLLSACLVAGSGLADDNAPVGSKQNPIKVHGVEMERFYCKFLRTPDGEEVEYERVGSVGEGPYGNILDWYKVKTKDGKKEWDVYIDMYHKDAKTLPQVAPPGLLTLQQYTASKLKGKRKQYINLSLPSGSQFCPVVAIHENHLSVARITPSAGGRDITVLRQEGNQWLPLGDKGSALTGGQKGYAFLDDMRVSPDKTLWVTSVYTFPYRTYSHRYRNRKWELAGPPEGDRPKSEVIWDSGIHFLGDATPCRIVETRDEGICILRLAEAGWDLAPVTEQVKRLVGDSTLWPEHIARRAQDTWLIWEAEGEGESTLRAVRIASPKPDGVTGPFDLMRFDSKLCVQSTAASPEGTIAANLTDGNYENGYVHLLQPVGKGGFSASKCPSVGKNSEFEDMRWAPDGTLIAARKSDDNGVELLGFKDGKWSSMYRHQQPTSEGNIGETKIFFRPDGKPCVVWADWFR